MNFQGIIIGLVVFLIIGILHPVVIKSEYYFGKKVWPVFLIGGFIAIIFSVIINNITMSIILGVLGFSLFWGIKELFEQEERVKKGWYPKKEKKK